MMTRQLKFKDKQIPTPYRGNIVPVKISLIIGTIRTFAIIINLMLATNPLNFILVQKIILNVVGTKECLVHSADSGKISKHLYKIKILTRCLLS